jgi:hypothetical protein
MKAVLCQVFGLHVVHQVVKGCNNGTEEQIAPRYRVWRVKSSVQGDGYPGCEESSGNKQCHGDAVLPVVRYKPDARDKQERREGNPVESAEDRDHPKDGGGQERRALLSEH